MKKSFILLLIVILATVLRFYKLNTYPALNADEAAIGYNAYSLLLTGKDEHGNSWPIHFQSFNDYKPGLFFYLVLPFVKFLGLNEWAVRIPGASLGVFSVIAVYFLVKELFPRVKSLPEVSSFFLAISPWHIHFSRGGWEVNASTLFIILGVLFFIKGLSSRNYFLPSAIFFVASLYTYHAARVVTPLLGLSLVLIYIRAVKKNIGILISLGVLGFALVVPLAKDLLGPDGLSRASGVGLFADPGPLSRVNEQRGEHGNYRSFIAKIYHNKPVNYTLAFLENWTDHFWGEFLFLSGDSIERDKVPETGVFYLQDFLFMIVALYLILKAPTSWRLILAWLVISPFASALTFQSPHALRAHNLVIPLTIISAFGFVGIVNFFKSKKSTLGAIGYCLVVLVVAWGFGRYVHMYYVHMAKEYPYSSQYGLKDLVNYVEEEGKKYSEVVITDRYDQPYILFLFYLKYSPKEFQGDHVLTPRDNFGFSTVRSFGKYRFEKIKYDLTRPENPNTLIVGTDEEIPKEANIVKRIIGPNGKPVFEIVAN